MLTKQETKENFGQINIFYQKYLDVCKCLG